MHLAAISCAVAILLQVPADSAAVTALIQGVDTDSLVIALQSQIAVMETANDRLLSTVHWSLGTIATVGLVLLGFGWFANFRVYERDKAAMQQELRGFLAEQMATTRAELRTAVEQAASQAVARLEAMVNAHSLRVGKLEILYDETELDKWMEAKVWDNAIRAGLNVARAADQEWRVTRALEKIMICVNAGAGADSFVYGDMLEVFDKLPDRHAGDINNIKRVVDDRRSRIGG